MIYITLKDTTPRIFCTYFLFFLMRVCVCVCFGIKEREDVIRTSRAGKREEVVVYKRSSLLILFMILKNVLYDELLIY